MKPDYVFETSWEICNKVGGIHTVLSTKALLLQEEFGDQFILIGPDVWREEKGNPEFLPDANLFAEWLENASAEGLRVRTGRWNIAGKPIVFLVDFTHLFESRNDIFARLWESYKLDSISGQWDYVEPALFGYAAGQVIESFNRYYCRPDKVVAHFHEWMTGTGALYLKKNAPGVATGFTTHATVLGRSLAGNNLPLYGQLEKYSPAQVARDFNVTSKYSLEKITAQNADVFTTVSQITAREAAALLGKEVDVVTPNGFNDSFVPREGDFTEKRKKARKLLLKAASAILGYELANDSFLVATSGRYEFKNKGIDLFIQSLDQLNKSELPRECVAFILVPANHSGPRRDLLDYLEGKSSEKLQGSRHLTHGMHQPENDPVLQLIEKYQLKNGQDDKVKLIFIPSYLQGEDGILNMPYYDVLTAFDLTAFPSYYEPWGYTPLESIAFSIPTVTTTLAGFGKWVNDHYPKPENGILVVERDDNNDEMVVQRITERLRSFLEMDAAQIRKAREKAFDISRIALWENLLEHYMDAWSKALEKCEERTNGHEIQVPDLQPVYVIRKPQEKAVWKDIYIESMVPEAIAALNDLSRNLWWCWNSDAEELFREIDAGLWEKCQHNPVLLLQQVEYKKLSQLAREKKYVEKVNAVNKRFREYMDRPYPEDSPIIAYFSMEFGIHSSLKIYSGGLGVLAGDYMKEASDSNAHIVGVGLLYRYGYFRQQLSMMGEQLALFDEEDFSNLPVEPVKDEDGEQMTVRIAWPGRVVFVRIWKVLVGKASLILLDTDSEFNKPQDREITHHLYGGSNENRLKQEIILGIGGIRALRALGIKPELYHSNEGHSALIGIERLRYLIQEKYMNYTEALEVVRGSTLFTTHTPVPAGHDAFDENLLRTYLGHYPARLKISWQELMELGRCCDERTSKFNMSYLACRLSQEINGVSMLHGQVSRQMFQKLYPGFLKEELHISHVTNGVHFPTWQAPEWKEAFNKLLDGKPFDQQNKDHWEQVLLMPDKEVWELKNKLKSQLITYIKGRIQKSFIDRRETPRKLMMINLKLNEKALTIGFARRFATYKRAHLLFQDLDRLAKIVNNPDRPVQFIFAGKAHPHDGGGKDLIKHIIEVSRRPEFAGRIIFLENYDMELARHMVQGVDIWLNTPTRPQEASGTSGEKAVMNGTLHFSVLDGWWVEGYKAYAGWALPQHKAFEDQNFQDELDSETIYNIIENEILPAFYGLDQSGIPLEWVSYVKNSIARIAPDFTMNRQMRDYYDRFYRKLYKRYTTMSGEQYASFRELSAWKQQMEKDWENIEVLSVKMERPADGVYRSGRNYLSRVLMDLKGIPREYVGVELLMTRQSEGDTELVMRREYEAAIDEKGLVSYSLDFTPDHPGSFSYGIRVFPKHKSLPHRLDFRLMKWI